MRHLISIYYNLSGTGESSIVEVKVYSRNKTAELQPTSRRKTISNTIKVTVDSKNITLPINKATLNAFISNSTLNKLNLKANDLKYSWKLVGVDGNDYHDGNSNVSVDITNADKETLVLSNLVKGRYRSKHGQLDHSHHDQRCSRRRYLRHHLAFSMER